MARFAVCIFEGEFSPHFLCMLHSFSMVMGAFILQPAFFKFFAHCDTISVSHRDEAVFPPEFVSAKRDMQ